MRIFSTISGPQLQSCDPLLDHKYIGIRIKLTSLKAQDSSDSEDFNTLPGTSWHPGILNSLKLYIYMVKRERHKIIQTIIFICLGGVMCMEITPEGGVGGRRWGF